MVTEASTEKTGLEGSVQVTDQDCWGMLTGDPAMEMTLSWSVIGLLSPVLQSPGRLRVIWVSTATSSAEPRLLTVTSAVTSKAVSMASGGGAPTVPGGASCAALSED